LGETNKENYPPTPLSTPPPTISGNRFKSQKDDTLLTDIEKECGVLG
jgi:hypothetical protein